MRPATICISRWSERRFREPPLIFERSNAVSSRKGNRHSRPEDFRKMQQYYPNATLSDGSCGNKVALIAGVNLRFRQVSGY